MACGYILFFFFFKFTVFALFYTHTLDSGISGDESQADGGRQKIPGFVVTWLAKRNLNSTAEESLSTLGNTQPSRQDETLAGNVSANRWHVSCVRNQNVSCRVKAVQPGNAVWDGFSTFVIMTPHLWPRMINYFRWERTWPAVFVAGF